MALPTKDEMRARFWDLKHAIDAKESAVAALREKYEPEWNAATAARKAHMEEIRSLEGDVGIDGLSMFDAKQEMAFLARGLGNVGSDPALEPSDA